MIEVEIRGVLAENEGRAFLNFLEAHASSKSIYDEVVLFFNTDQIENFGSFASGVARISATQKTYKDGTLSQVVKLKIGTPSSNGRTEFELILKEPGLTGFFEMMRRFGVREASFRSCNRHDYAIENMNISLKFNHPVGDHYEAEIQCGSEEEVEKTRQKIIEFLKPFHLTTWTESEYKQTIIASLTKAPYISLEDGVVKYKIM